MLLRGLKSRRAISPILATLLLIVIAVAATIITYTWIMTYMSSTGQQAGVILRLDNVQWPNTNQIILYVRNTGSSDVLLGNIYVGTSATNLQNATIVDMNPQSGLIAANGGVIRVTINYDWTSGITYYFRVAPKVGAPLEFSIKAP
jgi:flagellin-like protein